MVRSPYEPVSYSREQEKNEIPQSKAVKAGDCIPHILEEVCSKYEDSMNIIDTIIPNMSGVEVIREKVRQRLAYWSVFAYFATIITIIFFGKPMLSIEINEVVQLITTVAGILGGIVGAIIGFYYKSNGA